MYALLYIDLVDDLVDDYFSKWLLMEDKRCIAY